MPPEETTIFEDKEIKITSLRAIFGPKAYDISNITAVEVKRIPASGCVPVALAAFGLFLIVGGIVGDADNIRVRIVIMALGALPLLGGLIMTFIPQPSYVVQISTSSGDIKLFTSFDKSYIDQIVLALDNTIIQKG